MPTGEQLGLCFAAVPAASANINIFQGKGIIKRVILQPTNVAALAETQVTFTSRNGTTSYFVFNANDDLVGGSLVIELDVLIAPGVRIVNTNAAPATIDAGAGLRVTTGTFVTAVIVFQPLGLYP